MRKFGKTIIAAIGLLAAGWAQAQGFEVASVKLSAPSPEGGGHSAGPVESIDHTPVTLTMRNVSLQSAIRWAYALGNQQLSAPGQLSAQRYDIVAKAPSAVDEAQFRLMLRLLLAERFKLVVHWETREMTVHLLVVGKSGAKLQKSEQVGEGTVRPGRQGLQANRASMAQLADVLALAVGGPVMDKTELGGRYDFTLELASYVNREAQPKDMVASALQEQLGLRLEAAKLPVEMLVVDRVETAGALNN